MSYRFDLYTCIGCDVTQYNSKYLDPFFQHFAGKLNTYVPNLRQMQTNIHLYLDICPLHLGTKLYRQHILHHVLDLLAE